jgi:hypothetical protein
MALSVKNSALSTTASTSLTITNATAGNVLVCYAIQSASLLSIGFSDNVSGSTGWVTQSTHATNNSNNSSVYVATKSAVGGETTISTTAGSGGTVGSLCYFEIQGGASTRVETITAGSGGAATTSETSAAITTTNPGDIILAAAGFGNPTGAVFAWTGTHVMTNVSTSSSSLFIGGSYVPNAKLTSQNFTANWTTSRSPAGILTLALTPASGQFLQFM